MITGDFNSELKPFENLKAVLKEEDYTFMRERAAGRKIGQVKSRTDHVQISEVMEMDYIKEFNDLSDHALICARLKFKGSRKQKNRE